MQKKIIALVLAVMLVLSLMVPAYAAEPEVADTAASTITVYFTDNAGFGTPNVYYWDNGGSWPGHAMTYVEDNDFGEKIYSAEIPAAGVSGIIFNGNGKQTVDITTGIVSNAQWYTANGTDSQGSYNVEVTTYGGHQEATTAPITGETITVYFTDNAGFGTPNVYYWDGGSEWPGDAMTFSETNDFGENVYKATVPANVTGIIFNGNGKQTVDITTGIADNVQWYTANGQESNGNYKVESTVHGQSATQSQDSTSAPVTGDTITVYFTDNAGFGTPNVYYWDGGAAWPGSQMTFSEQNGFGENVYKATIPANVSGVIFNGNGKQTVDITTGIADNVQWYTNGEFEGSNYKVDSTTHGDQTSTEASTEASTETSTQTPSDSITVYFTNNADFGEVPYIYYWENGGEFPGSQMTFSETNDFNENVFKATIPANVTGVVFSGNGKQTVDITTGIANNVQWYAANGTDSQGHFNVESVIHGESSTVAPGSYACYIVGNMNDWTPVEAYRMTMNGSTFTYSNLALTTTSMFKVLWVEGDYRAWYPDGTGNAYGENGEIKANGNYDVTFDATTHTTTVTAAGTPSSEQPTPDTITVFFTASEGFGEPNLYYWEGGAEWPGTKMTYVETNDYGQDVYKGTIPANVTGIIFNGNGKQTVDITTGITDYMQWYPTGEMEGNNYKVDTYQRPMPTQAETQASTEKATEKPTQPPVTGGPQITKQPTDWTGFDGDHIVIDVEATGNGLTYQWYYWKASKNKWVAADDKDASYDALVMAPNFEGRQVKVKVTDANGKSVESSVATISYAEAVGPTIIEQPNDWYGEDGYAITIPLVAQGDGLTYQWYYYKESKAKWVAAADTDDTYSGINMAPQYENRAVKCKITDAAGYSIYSDVAYIKYPLIRITQQPQDWEGQDGDTVNISVVAEGEDLTYQWYYYKESKAKWVAAADTDSVYDSIVMAPQYENRAVKCKITNASGLSVMSDVAYVRYGEVAPTSPIVIKSEPQDWTGNDGETTTIHVEAVGTALHYQWYYWKASKNKWIASEDKDSTYNVTMSSSMNGRKVKCKLTDVFGNELYTKEATISYPAQ